MCRTCRLQEVELRYQTLYIERAPKQTMLLFRSIIRKIPVCKGSIRLDIQRANVDEWIEKITRGKANCVNIIPGMASMKTH